MYNKELYDKIINVNCPADEMYELDISEQEVDIDNAFEKYFDVNKILYAISRYENKDVNDQYLACWANDYNWIINGGFKKNLENKAMDFECWIVREISDWLDSLSFFDDTEDAFELENYKNVFLTFDKIYRNRVDWKCVFASEEDGADDDHPVIVLVYNDKTKQFASIHNFISWQHDEVKIEKIQTSEFSKKIKALKRAGYKEI